MRAEIEHHTKQISLPQRVSNITLTLDEHVMLKHGPIAERERERERERETVCVKNMKF